MPYKVKGEEAQVAFEELRARDGRVSPGGVGGAGPSSERDLLDRIIYLEKELGQRDSLLAGERERGAAAPRGEVRYLREENEDLKVCVCVCVVSLHVPGNFAAMTFFAVGVHP